MKLSTQILHAVEYFFSKKPVIDAFEKANSPTYDNPIATMADVTSVSTSWRKEVPSGATNGINRVFTIQNTPVAGTDMVFLSGQLQAGSGVDYALANKTITFNIAPNIGEQLFAFYQKS